MAYDPGLEPAGPTEGEDGVGPRPFSERPSMSETPRQAEAGRFARFRGAVSTASLGRSPLWLAIEAGLLLRILAANIVEWRVSRGGGTRVCLFPDAEYYWKLAQTIRDGALFQIVEWGDIPHFALRTPGYPLFLAGCRMIAGDRPLGARLIQAGLGALTVWLVYRLTRTVFANDHNAGETNSGGERLALIAAGLAAVHPYFVFTSALLLSEAVFIPLMLVSLWGGAALWNRRDGEKGIAGPALVVGLASGAAVLTRPSWVLFPLLMLGAWFGFRWLAGRSLRPALGAGLIAAVGFVVVMGPWWVRNARLYGEFVPTALWMGASLYDGLNPNATGASDMRFLGDPEIWPLDERGQNDELKRRALAFVRAEPGRALRLAIVKLGRYWSPWPNAEGLRSPLVAIASGLVMIPLLSLIALGIWLRRDCPPAWILLAGPLLYFCCVHMIFASSMRYRTPAEVPAMGLAAAGLVRVFRGRAGVDHPTPPGESEENLRQFP